MIWLVAFAISMAATFSASPAFAARSTIGNFAISVEKDPFNDGEKFIAVTVQSAGGLAIRCLDGDQSIMFIVDQQASKGDSVAIKIRIDDGEIQDFDSTVLRAEGNHSSFEVGNADLIAKLANARQIAIKYELNSVVASGIFQLREPAKIVAGVRKACKAN